MLCGDEMSKYTRQHPHILSTFSETNGACFLCWKTKKRGNTLFCIAHLCLFVRAVPANSFGLFWRHITVDSRGSAPVAIPTLRVETLLRRSKGVSKHFCSNLRITAMTLCAYWALLRRGKGVSKHFCSNLRITAVTLRTYWALLRRGKGVSKHFCSNLRITAVTLRTYWALLRRGKDVSDP